MLDQRLDFGAIGADILKRRYITIGMTCFIVLLPLAVTSSNLAIRRLGGKVWQRLHRFVYLAAILAVLHFLMSVKSWPIEPVTYALIVAILLGYRLARYLMQGQRQGKPKRMSESVLNHRGSLIRPLSRRQEEFERATARCSLPPTR